MATRSVGLPPISEAAFQRQVLDAARLFGWTVYHTKLSAWSNPGFPDLTMVRGPRLIFAELKREKGRTTPMQDAWLAALAYTCAEVYVWRPSDIDAIIKRLR